MIPPESGKEARLTTLAASLSEQPDEARAIAKRAELSQREVHRLLSILVEEKLALREGKGTKKVLRIVLRKVQSNATPLSIGHESNSINADSIHRPPRPPA